MDSIARAIGQTMAASIVVMASAIVFYSLYDTARLRTIKRGRVMALVAGIYTAGLYLLFATGATIAPTVVSMIAGRLAIILLLSALALYLLPDLD